MLECFVACIGPLIVLKVINLQTFCHAGGCLDQEKMEGSHNPCVNICIMPSQQALNFARNKLQTLKIGPTDAEILFDKV
jgi:hypothetical protein